MKSLLTLVIAFTAFSYLGVPAKASTCDAIKATSNLKIAVAKSSSKRLADVDNALRFGQAAERGFNECESWTSDKSEYALFYAGDAAAIYATAFALKTRDGKTEKVRRGMRLVMDAMHEVMENPAASHEALGLARRVYALAKLDS